ncbi:steroid 5-alpha-reductase DET2-like isoform X2 [Cornus florida]|uniref:steroid 5-alpha-reductase DET2-like isoform X2 n=1 Tax=Cornus florida TaxID=4283 RepID=UPI002896A0BE|nr:steroid 5-alpha-reductase DET2-like isoform X2 [Cornus florida]
MVMSVLMRFIYPQPPPVFITAMCVISVVSLALFGLSEIIGKHLQYSKFWNADSHKFIAKQIKLSSRTGMLMLYAPAFLASLASFALFPRQGFRFLLVNSALTIHFFKRILEVLFIHKYSGAMILDSVITISLSYCISTATMIYAQHLTQGFPEPPVDLKYVGIVIFLVGISGNFYHHYLLSKLREEGDKEYKVPKGGLFDLVICPHYFFEILGFVGISCISQTLYAFSFTLGTTFYLMGRSYATRKWYLSKFEDFPKNVKALIPYVF